ncbi:helix-turn-helix domain-containing protein [Butyribacter intestini]|jgi:transcriptional regulator with XRE-family HTH domain|uniref:helix-turn-helix domain-containing protein n=1 Tax=Butyribacter intestini TaxID=1703332 RepID=UPI0022E984DC|nr:helix-turn-helix transcriptional regulator [Butyribacter intestini]
MCKINGKKLEELRIERGLSRLELATKIGMSKSSIQKYEVGVANPSDKVADKICMILKINRGEIEMHDVGYNFMDQRSKTVDKYRLQKGFHRYSTPEETEKIITDACKENDEKIKSEIKSAFNVSVGIGDRKKYIQIDPTFVHVPTWQRDTDIAKAMEIAENFKEDKFDPIKGYINTDGKLDIADGMHRIIALIFYNKDKKDDEKLKAIIDVLNCNEIEAILTFLGQQSGRKTMSVADTYRAGVKANIKEYIDFKNLFEGYNIQITSEMHKLKNPIGVINPSGEALRLVERDRETLIKVLDLIIKLDWCGAKKNVFIIRNLKALQSLYATYGDEIEEKLLKNCKGAVYFESKISCITSKAELYDILSAEISK